LVFVGLLVLLAVVVEWVEVVFVEVEEVVGAENADEVEPDEEAGALVMLATLLDAPEVVRVPVPV